MLDLRQPGERRQMDGGFDKRGLQASKELLRRPAIVSRGISQHSFPFIWPSALRSYAQVPSVDREAGQLCVTLG